MSRKASRNLINRHHQLEKQHRRAIDSGNEDAAVTLKSELESLGGLRSYQAASLQGQSHERGGDTSRVLLEWIPTEKLRNHRERLRLLEVGALSTQNACSTSDVFDVVHIDLNSQEPGIEQQDFMQRPLPLDEDEKFHIISLSLVLNYVPDAADRGRMLQRTLSFLYDINTVNVTVATDITPALFMVLPRSCTTNSRYLTNSRLLELMVRLGYTQLRAKATQKLSYSLWKKAGKPLNDCIEFPKKEVNPGSRRNNFTITLRKP